MLQKTTLISNKERLKKIFGKIKTLYSYDEIILGVNHKCNLDCKFCYINYSNSLQTKEMTLKEYSKLIRDAKKLGVDGYRIAEREPFYTPKKTFQVINLIRKIYSESPKKSVEISLVTNGILAKKNLQKAIDKKIFLDHMIFSIDGFDDTHRFLRNIKNDIKGYVVKQLLQTAKDYRVSGVAKKVWINSVLTSKNYGEIPEFIKYAHKFDSKFNLFSIDIFNENIEKKNGYLKTNKKQFIEFIKNMIKISKEENISTELIILGNKQMRPYLKWLREEDYLQGNSKIDANLFYINDSNSPFKIYYQLFPTEYIRSIRVSSDGFVMGIGREIMKGDYRKHSIGNMKNRTLKQLWNEIREKSMELIVEEYYG